MPELPTMVTLSPTLPVQATHVFMEPFSEEFVSSGIKTPVSLRSVESLDVL